MISEYADALPLLQTALGELQTGQLIAAEGYGMMDLMSAIEINDPRTDTYLHSLRAREARDPPLPPFDAARELDVQEVRWIADGVVRLEATFHDGHPLPSTLWTCNYLRPSSLSAMCGSSSPQPERVGGQNPLRTVVLRALLLGTLKCTEIVWEEMAKGQVYEGQGEQEQPERTVSVDDVLRALDEAAMWLREQDGLGEEVDELEKRVRVRMDLLYVFALFTSPSHTSPSQLASYLSRLSSASASLPPASTPSPFTPSPALLSAFAPSSTLPLLSAQQPPRPVTPLPVNEAYDLLVRKTAEELSGLVKLWQPWTVPGEPSEGAGWKELREYCAEAGRAASSRSPYLRSLTQSLISTPSHLFSLRPPLSLSLSFLSTLSGLSPIFLTRLSYLRATETSASAPAHRALAWAERLAATYLLPTTSGLAGQNRGRQRRIAVKSVPNFAGLVQEAERDAVPLLRELAPLIGAEPADVAALARIPQAMAVHALHCVLEALLSGFEADVGLFSAEGDLDGEGRRGGWWVAGRVAGQIERLLGELEQGPEAMWEGREYVQAKRAEAKALREMCSGSFLMASLFPPASAKYSNPFLADLALPAEAAAKGRFVQRFGWLEKLCTLETEALSGCGEVGGWEAYRKEVERVGGMEPADLARLAGDSYASALSSLTSLGSIPLAAKGATVRPELSLRRRTAVGNQNRVERFLREQGEHGKAELRWESEWFPVWS
ncbi:N-alpha-acetyltransferase, non-catalitic subunit [Rhodosporidiobolus nylandii]